MIPRAQHHRAVFEAWSIAVEARHASALAKLNVPSGVFLPPDGRPIKGPAAIRESWRQWFTLPRLSLSFCRIESLLYPSGDIASGNSAYVLTYGEPGNRVRDEGRLLVVAVKTEDQWGIRFNAFFSDAYLWLARDLAS
ncbi:MAG TPA: nuclear transport factor 2 family protein [Gemmatimonadota bacterium]|nr:nuclear transport factor 2 family protein [Gemmatimonadota bacterium]